ncbi:MAG: glycerol-3-phosphate dehydrogenase/oxidase [Acidobacteriota bacterium]|nr:glycerol-3-phosphate dehydrogenase/oxidase [Acidobacteriota bacterium]
MKALLPPRSTPTRDAALERLAAREWDLLVIGGGITGVAVARDAALRGLQVALIEQGDFAFGTSSRSSRLIHGGLRYLAGFDFGLVREGLVERRRLLETAPGLVRPVRFLYPVYRGDPDSLWKVNLGVLLYETLAFGYGLGGRRWLGRRGLTQSVPGLRRDNLRGGVSYFDAATHDTRLTLAVAASAEHAGALLVSRCRAERLVESDGQITGAESTDLLGRRTLQVRARSTVLCCGPWQTLYPAASVSMRTARGSHISLPSRRVPLDCFITLRSPRDGRLAFAMPVGEHVVLGTTDEDDAVAPAEVRPTPADTDYLLELANHAFPSADVGRADVSGAWAGLRPLLADGSHLDADDISRRHRIISGPPGLWILAGGKLTTHRRMAEDLVDTIAPHLADAGVAIGPCLTKTKKLLPGSVVLGRKRLNEKEVATATVDGLAALYGGRLEVLATRLSNASGEVDSESLLRAQVELAIDDEWTLSLDDLLLRRIGPGALDLKSCIAQAEPAARLMAARLGWSKEDTRREIDEFHAGARRDLAAAGIDPSATTQRVGS